MSNEENKGNPDVEEDHDWKLEIGNVAEVVEKKPPNDVILEYELVKKPEENTSDE